METTRVYQERKRREDRECPNLSPDRTLCFRLLVHSAKNYLDTASPQRLEWPMGYCPRYTLSKRCLTVPHFLCTQFRSRSYPSGDAAMSSPRRLSSAFTLI